MSDPLTMWVMECPFSKHGTPVVGNMGRTIRRVVVMEAETFKAMLAAHPSLKTQEFKVGTFDADEPNALRASGTRP